MRKTLEDLTAPYRCVIFDFDGTLFFLDVDWAALKRALSSRFDGYDFSRLSHGLTDLRAKQGDLLAEDAYRVVHRFETAMAAVPNLPMIDLARTCHTRGQSLGIFSANTCATIGRSLEEFNITSLFSVVVGGDSVRMRKPHPEGLVTAITALGGRAQDSIYLADGESEGETGRRAEVRTVVLDAA